MEGSLVTHLPGAECELEFPFQIARKNYDSTGQQSGAAMNPPALHLTAPLTSEACMRSLRRAGSIRTPVGWAEFDKIDTGLTGVRELGEQTVRTEEGDVQCAVLEVVYDEYYQRIRQFSGTVRYWVDVESQLIRRVEFTQPNRGGPRRWVATIKRISFHVQAPAWLEQIESPRLGTSLIGKTAPDFTLQTSDGRAVHLATLRGKKVVLNFWATWCLPCEEDIPYLEKLQAETNGSDLVVLGVSEERGAVVRDWIKRNHRSFRTLVGGGNVFLAYGIKPIPALVLIDKQGNVRDHIVGVFPKDNLRQYLEDKFAK